MPMLPDGTRLPYPREKDRPRPPRPTADALARDPQNNIMRQQYLQSLFSSPMPSSSWEDPYYRFPPQPRTMPPSSWEDPDYRFPPQPMSRPQAGELENTTPSWEDMQLNALLRQLGILR